MVDIKLKYEISVANHLETPIISHTEQIFLIFDVLLTVHSSIFNLVINQLDAQNLMQKIITPIGVMIPEAV
jgi:hypothetical protein